MADIQKRIAQLQAVRKKTKSEAGKKAIDSKIAKLEAQAQEAKVEKPVEKEVEAPVEKPKKERKPRAKAEPKAKPKKATRFVFEKPVDGGKEVKVVEAMTEAEAKEAMDGTDFDFVKQITRGRSPREGFVADKKAPAKKKEAEKPKRKPRASKDERTSMAKAAGMSETRAKKISEKVATGKKRGRKPMDKEAWLFEMPLKTQAGKVKRKIVKATNEKAAIKSAGPSYKLVRKLSEGESPKVGTMEMEGYVAPPKRGRGRPKGAKNKVKASVKPSRKPSRKSRAAIKAKSEDIGEGIAIADEVSKMGLRMDVASAMQTLQKLTTRYDLALEGAEKVVGNLQAGTTHLNDLRAAILAMVEDDKKMAKGGQTQSDVMKGLNDFAMFALNFPPNFVSDAFDGNQHLIKKFNDLYDRVGSDAVVVKFYAQLDGGNKRRLQEYIADVYSNKMARGGKVKRGGRKMAQGGLAIHFDDDYTHKDEIENLLMSKTYMGDNEYLTDYGSSFYVYSDDISPIGVRDAYESIIEEGYDENVELELFAKGGKVKRGDYESALQEAIAMGVNFERDFHAQSIGGEMDELATKYGYRKPKSASGSKGRMFFQKLQRMDSKKMAEGGKTKGEVEIILTDDDLGYYSIFHRGKFIEKEFTSLKEAQDWARANNYIYKESFAKGGTTEGKPKVESLEEVFFLMDGTEVAIDDMDDAEKMFGGDPLTPQELVDQLAADHDIYVMDAAPELFDLPDRDDEDDDEFYTGDLKDGVTIDDIEDAIEDQLQADNSYNYSAPFVFDVRFTKTRDAYDPQIMLVREHFGGDVRGNYGDYYAFSIDADTNPFYGNVELDITTNKGHIGLRAEGLESYNFYVISDDTGTFEDDDVISRGEIEEALDFGKVKSEILYIND